MTIKRPHPAAHGQFRAIRQVASVCMLDSSGHAKSLTQTVSIGSAQLTTERPYTLQWAALYPQNCPFPWGFLDPHLTHNFLGVSEPITRTASRLDWPFLHHSAQRVYILYKLQRVASSSLKIALFHGGSGLQSNTWFLGHIRVLNTNGISIG